MDGASGSGSVYLCLSCSASFDCARGLNVHKTKKHGLVESAPHTRNRKRKVSAQVVVGADAYVSSWDEETGAGGETEYSADATEYSADATEYTADDYELPAGESHSVYYDCDWGD